MTPAERAVVEVWSLKRIAWAFGCAKNGSEIERELELLLRRILIEGK